MKKAKRFLVLFLFLVLGLVTVTFANSKNEVELKEANAKNEAKVKEGKVVETDNNEEEKELTEVEEVQVVNTINTVQNVEDTTPPTLTLKDESVGTNSVYSQVWFKLYDSNSVDYIVINGNKKELSNNKWSDANYSNIKGYLTEGENVIELYDVAGNKTTQTYTIDWTAPEVIDMKQKYETKENGRIRVTVTLSEAIQGILGQGWYAVSGQENTYSKIYYKTKEYTLSFKDLAGNEGSYTFEVDKTPNRVTQTFYRGTNYVGKTYYLTKGDKVQFNIGFREKLGEDAVVTIGGKKVELTYEKYFKATNSHMYYAYLEADENESVLQEGELEISISNITDEVGNPGFYYQTNGKKVIESYKNVKTTNGKVVVYDAAAPTLETQLRTDLEDRRTDVIGKDTHNIVFTIFKDDKLVKTVDQGVNYKRFSIDWLGEGTYKVVVTDVAGQTAEKEVIIDHTAPVVTLKGKGKVREPGHYTFTLQAIIEDDNEYTALLNGKEYTSGKDITARDNYTLVVTDIIGNTTTIEFAIDKDKPKIKGVENGKFYKNSVTPEVTDKNLDKVTLNGEDYVVGTTITEDGKYTLVASDKAGNKNTVEFTIDKTAPKFRFTKSGSSLAKDEIEPKVIDGVYYFNQPIRLTISDNINLRLHGVNSYYDDNNPNRTGWLTEVKNDGEYTAVGEDSTGNRSEIKIVIDTTHEGPAGGGGMVEPIPEDSDEFIVLRGDALDKFFNIKTMISFNIAEPSRIKEVRFYNSTVGEGYGTTQTVSADKLYGYSSNGGDGEYVTQVNFSFNEALYFAAENIIKGDNAVLVLEDKAGNTFELELQQDIPIYR